MKIWMNSFTSPIAFHVAMVDFRLETLNKGSRTTGVRHLQCRIGLLCISHVPFQHLTQHFPLMLYSNIRSAFCLCSRGVQGLVSECWPSAPEAELSGQSCSSSAHPWCCETAALGRESRHWRCLQKCMCCRSCRCSEMAPRNGWVWSARGAHQSHAIAEWNIIQGSVLCQCLTLVGRQWRLWALPKAQVAGAQQTSGIQGEAWQKEVPKRHLQSSQLCPPWIGTLGLSHIWSLLLVVLWDRSTKSHHWSVCK